MVALVRHFLRIESSREAAERSYKAVMERYPNNPRYCSSSPVHLLPLGNSTSSLDSFESEKWPCCD